MNMPKEAALVMARFQKDAFLCCAFELNFITNVVFLQVSRGSRSSVLMYTHKQILAL